MAYFHGSGTTAGSRRAVTVSGGKKVFLLGKIRVLW